MDNCYSVMTQSLKWLVNEVDDQGSILSRGTDSYFRHHLQTSSAPHPASGGSFSESKADPLSPSSIEV